MIDVPAVTAFLRICTAERTATPLKSEHFPPGADAQVERVASRFGLVAAAGELGIRFGVLPWDKGEADKAAEKCFNSWLARRGFTGAYDIEAGIAAVRKFIELHGDSRFYPAWNPPAPDYPVSNRAGFRLTSGEETEFFVLPEVWREILCGFDLVAINKALIERGLLLADGEGHACRSQHVKGVGQKRVYHLSPKILLEGEEVCATE